MRWTWCSIFLGCALLAGCGNTTNPCAGKEDETPCGSDTVTDCDNADICIDEECVDNYVAADTNCGGAPVGECDAQDTCDGEGTCVDNFVAADTNCGGAPSGDCDAQDTCDGAGTCTSNSADAGTACGDQGVVCRKNDSCDGAGTCVDAGFADVGTGCGGEGGCEESCDVSGDCVVGMASNGAPCGDLTDTECNPADTCLDGTCQDNLATEGAACGDTTDDDCLNPDECDGEGNCLDNDEDDETPCGDGDSDACDAPDSCLDGVCEPNYAEEGTNCQEGEPGVCEADDECDGAGSCEDAGFEPGCTVDITGRVTRMVEDPGPPPALVGTRGIGPPPDSVAGAMVSIIGTAVSDVSGPDGSFELDDVPFDPSGAVLLQVGAIDIGEGPDEQLWGLIMPIPLESEEIDLSGEGGDGVELISEADIAFVQDALLEADPQGDYSVVDTKGIVALNFENLPMEKAIGGETADLTPPNYDFTFVFDAPEPPPALQPRGGPPPGDDDDDDEGPPIPEDELVAGGGTSLVFVNVNTGTKQVTDVEGAGDYDCEITDVITDWPVAAKTLTDIPIDCEFTGVK